MYQLERIQDGVKWSWGPVVRQLVGVVPGHGEAVNGDEVGLR